MEATNTPPAGQAGTVAPGVTGSRRMSLSEIRDALARGKGTLLGAVCLDEAKRIAQELGAPDLYGLTGADGRTSYWVPESALPDGGAVFSAAWLEANAEERQ